MLLSIGVSIIRETRLPVDSLFTVGLQQMQRALINERTTSGGISEAKKTRIHNKIASLRAAEANGKLMAQPGYLVQETLQRKNIDVDRKWLDPTEVTHSTKCIS